MCQKGKKFQQNLNRGVIKAMQNDLPTGGLGQGLDFARS
jgi:hypothetical protein